MLDCTTHICFQKTILAVLDSLMEDDDGLYSMNVEPLETTKDSEVKGCNGRKKDTIFQILARKERRVHSVCVLLSACLCLSVSVCVMFMSACVHPPSLSLFHSLPLALSLSLSLIPIFLYLPHFPLPVPRPFPSSYRSPIFLYAFICLKITLYQLAKYHCHKLLNQLLLCERLFLSKL